jgi:UDP-N-acetylglucosamine acyltransferase
MVGGQAHITKDVPPFMTIDGATSFIVGLNVVGLRRAGLTSAELADLKEAYRIVFRRGLRWSEAIELLRRTYPTGRGATLAKFLETTKRGCTQERRVPRGAILKLHTPDREASAEDAQTPARERRAS